VKSIYIHSKILIADDELLVTGSTNTDNISFFYSSELSLTLYDVDIASGVRMRLFEEHLGLHYPHRDPTFDRCFEAFKKVRTPLFS
jgi:phosphatidylserine/phosphatidylglycerophosphate/cardiolipin synthase-like enzyme